MTRIIADIKNKSDADLIYRFIKRFRAGRVKMMNEREWEDYVLGKMAEEAESEGGAVSRAAIARIFKRHGIDF